jgi:hypothetical protein
VPSRPSGEFHKNVFINCPFDDEYRLLLRALLFTVACLGFNPKIALESSDSGEIRLSKICTLIRDSKYSIHDLSRLQSKSADEFYRLNMPFELGIDYGCRQYSSNHLREKRCLILERERFNFMKAISDLSGVDIKNHKNEPAHLVREVRNWFVETVGVRGIASPTVLWYRFNGFMLDFHDKRKAEGFSDEDLDMMPVPEFITFIQEWVRENTEARPAI